MPEQQPFAGRIEQKLDALQSKIDILSEKVIILAAINEAHKSQSETNARDIESMKKDIGFAKGAAWVCGILLTLATGTVGWAFNKIDSLNTKIDSQGQVISGKFENVNLELGKTNTQVSINASKILRIDTDLNGRGEHP